MKRNSSTGFLFGLTGGIVTALVASVIWFELQMSGYLDEMQKSVIEAQHKNTFLNLTFIRMAENGETERLIRAYCTLLQSRLKYIDPETIEDAELKTKLIETKKEAASIIATLESEGKCLTKR